MTCLMTISVNQIKAFYLITLDSLDIGVTANEYLVGDTDKSKHWTSSLLVEGQTII